MIRKILKIVLTVLFSIIVLAVIFVLVVSHNPAFYRAVYPGIDDCIADYPKLDDIVIPDDYVPYKSNGITIRVPEECIDDGGVTGIRRVKSDRLFILILPELGEYEPDYEDFFDEKDYDHFYKKLGESTPASDYESIVFLRDRFNAESCRGLHGKDLLIFNFEAFAKKNVTGIETPYFYRGDNFEGLICDVGIWQKKTTNVMVNDPERHRSKLVTIICEEDELKKQIIKSLDASEYLNISSDNNENGNVNSTVAEITAVNDMPGTRDVAELKEKFPEYFELSDFKGIEVYVWQMAENSYLCGLMSGTNRSKTSEEIMSLQSKSLSIDEAKVILNELGVKKEDIIIIPISQPYSSYAYEINDEYSERVKQLFE